MVDLAAAVWERLRLSQIFDGTALHARLDEFGFIPSATQFRLPVFFAISPVCTLRYVSEAFQDRANGPGGLRCRHRFSTGVQMEMSVRITKSLAAAFATREQISLLNIAIMTALLSFDKCLIQLSRFNSLLMRF